MSTCLLKMNWKAEAQRARELVDKRSDGSEFHHELAVQDSSLGQDGSYEMGACAQDVSHRHPHSPK